MGIDSRPFGGVTLTGKDARAFREQFLGETFDDRQYDLFDWLAKKQEDTPVRDDDSEQAPGA